MIYINIDMVSQVGNCEYYISKYNTYISSYIRTQINIIQN